MRYLAVAIVCLAVGFAGGWAAFGSPFSSDPSEPSHDDAAATRLLQDVRVKAPDADSASCNPRPASTDLLCTVIFGLGAGSASDIATYVVHADGSFDRRQ